jgi:Na+/alanine symporter
VSVFSKSNYSYQNAAFYANELVSYPGCLLLPNIIGLLILAPEVKRDLIAYLKKLKQGELG